MESKKRTDAENQCQGKTAYDTFEQARQFSIRQNNGKRKRIEPYKCSTCGLIHVGHQTRFKMQPHREKKFIPFVPDDKVKRVIHNPQAQKQSKIEPACYTIADVLNQMNIKL